jgi:hypothetical protein
MDAELLDRIKISCLVVPSRTGGLKGAGCSAYVFKTFKFVSS